MASRVSTPKNSEQSAMKATETFTTKTTDHLAIPPSPIKERSDIHHNPLKSQSHCSNDLGSKDDTFFDSQAWLESDGEDDFFSVNGDLTPYHGNAPVHHSFSIGKNQVNTPQGDRAPGLIQEPSPKQNRKKLVDLFRERVEEDQDDEQDCSTNKKVTDGEKVVNPTIQSVLELPPKSADGTHVSGTNSFCSSERTANGNIPMHKVKPIRTAQCCLPGLVSCRSFSERKKRMSPANNCGN